MTGYMVILHEITHTISKHPQNQHSTHEILIPAKQCCNRIKTTKYQDMNNTINILLRLTISPNDALGFSSFVRERSACEYKKNALIARFGLFGS
jgi:hypothetical protein